VSRAEAIKGQHDGKRGKKDGLLVTCSPAAGVVLGRRRCAVVVRTLWQHGLMMRLLGDRVVGCYCCAVAMPWLAPSWPQGTMAMEALDWEEAESKIGSMAVGRGRW
jgi:hypothetical protein